MIDYAQIAQDAHGMIVEAGRQITIKRYATSRNSATGAVTKAAVEVATPYAVELPAAKGLQIFESQLKAESLTVQQVRFFVLEAVWQTFAPLPGDEALIDNVVWPIKGVNGCTPATVAITYNIMVAK
jgi:hypothetical protein